jgi:hypothetical protein
MEWLPTVEPPAFSCRRMSTLGAKKKREEQRAAPIISAVKSVAEPTGRGMAPVALPLVARKVSELQDNFASLDLELSAEQLKSLDDASRIELGFPQSIYRILGRPRFQSGTSSVGRPVRLQLGRRIRIRPGPRSVREPSYFIALTRTPRRDL